MAKRKQIQAAINRSAELLGIFDPQNAAILSNTTASFTQELLYTINNNRTRIDTLEAKLDSIAGLFNITFDSNNAIASEAYTTHKHNYVDDTINDTADGSGIITSTNKVTNGVNS